MNTILRASLVAGLVGLFAPPAGATLIDVTVTGKVISGSDIGGFFGTPGADLTNQSFTALYRFDTSLGTPTSTSTWIRNFGFGANSPSLGAVVTINGQQLLIPGNSLGELYGESDSTDNFAYYISEGSTSNVFFSLYNDVATLKPLGDPVPVAFVPFFLDNPSNSDGDLRARSELTGEQLLRLDLQPDTVTLSYPAAVGVPGPTVGAGLPGLLLAGSLLGWYRRRQQITGQLCS